MTKRVNLTTALLLMIMSLFIFSCTNNAVSPETESKFDSNVINHDTEIQHNNSPKSVQCSARTLKKQRCKRITSNPNGRCWQH